MRLKLTLLVSIAVLGVSRLSHAASAADVAAAAGSEARSAQAHAAGNDPLAIDEMQAAYNLDPTAARLWRLAELRGATNRPVAGKLHQQLVEQFPASKERSLAEFKLKLEQRLAEKGNRPARCANPAACGALAEDILRGRNGQAQNVTKARTMSLAACTAGDGPSCVRAGRLVDLIGDPAASLTLYQAGCALNDPDSCGAWGLGLAERPVSAAGTEALEVLEKKCAADPRTCVGFGALRSVDYGASKKDPELALTSYQQSCEAKVDYGCLQYGTALINSGKKTARAQGLEVLKQSCALDGRFSCKVAALVTDRQDKVAARALFETACERGDVALCTYTASSDLASTDEAVRKVAITTLERLCASDGSACILAAGYDKGQGDLKAAAAAADNGCLLRDPASCETIGVWLGNGTGIPQDDVRAMSVNRLSCEDFHRPVSCFLLAEATLKARAARAKAGQPEQGAGEITLAEITTSVDATCAAGKMRRACVAAGEVHTSQALGPSRKEELTRAFEAYGKACTLGAEEACALRDQAKVAAAAVVAEKPVEKPAEKPAAVPKRPRIALPDPLAPFPCPLEDDAKACAAHDKCMAATAADELKMGTGVCFASGIELTMGVLRLHRGDFRGLSGTELDDRMAALEPARAKMNQRYLARGCALGSLSACEKFGLLETNGALSLQILGDGCDVATARLAQEVADGQPSPWTRDRASTLCEARDQADRRLNKPVAVLKNEHVAETLRLLATKKTLKGANLANKLLEGIDLTGVDLSGANLSGAKLSKAKLGNVDLRGATLDKADLEDAFLRGAKLAGVKARGTSINLYGTGLVSDADFTGANIFGDLSAGTFENVNFSRANFGQTADLHGVDLRKTNIDGARFDNSNLSDVNLSSMSIASASFLMANMFRANLAGTTLIEVRLEKASLMSANLKGATFTKVNAASVRFDEADLTGARWTDVNADGADFEKAKTSGARFKDVNLCGARTTGTVFSCEHCKCG